MALDLFDGHRKKIEDLARNDARELDRQFYIFCERLVGVAAQLNYKTKVYRTAMPLHFPTLSIEKKRGILTGLSVFLEICESAMAANTDVKQGSPNLLWWAFKKLGMHPRSDLFSLINSQDAIEIYNTDHVQVFRSMNMFECLSYTLDELLSFEWWQLYQRDSVHTEQFVATLQELVAGKISDTVIINGPQHWVQEIFSEFNCRSLISTRLFSPLYNKQGVAGYLSATRIFESYDGQGIRLI